MKRPKKLNRKTKKQKYGNAKNYLKARAEQSQNESGKNVNDELEDLQL